MCQCATSRSLNAASYGVIVTRMSITHSPTAATGVDKAVCLTTLSVYNVFVLSLPQGMHEVSRTAWSAASRRWTWLVARQVTSSPVPKAK